MKLGLLSFTNGILIMVVVAEMIAAAHKGEDARLAAAGFVGSFVLFTQLSVRFE